MTAPSSSLAAFYLSKNQGLANDFLSASRPQGQRPASHHPSATRWVKRPTQLKP